MNDVINNFAGPYAWLSNFYISPIIYNGLSYSTNEHFFQSKKIANFHDSEKVRTVINPGKAKRLGRKFEMIEKWDDVKIETMLLGLFLKFSQHPDLKQALINTGDAILIEGNRWHDNFWGDCVCPKCSKIEGMNHLGKSLMRLRSIFKKWN